MTIPNVESRGEAVTVYRNGALVTRVAEIGGNGGGCPSRGPTDCAIPRPECDGDGPLGTISLVFVGLDVLTGGGGGASLKRPRALISTC